MNHNLLPSDRTAVAAAINPASHGAGAVSTPWISMATFFSMMALIQAGALGASATVDAKIEQAKDATGTDAKDVTGKAITQLTQADGDDNKQAIINIGQRDLDMANDFDHVRLTLTVGTAASQVAAVLLGVDARYGTAAANDAASVDEIVA
jgi:hypothetical protein